MKYYIFMQGNLHSTPAGLQKSALQRASAFKRREMDTIILTNNYNPNHENEMNKLRTKGLLNTPVYSMYSDFEKDSLDIIGNIIDDNTLSTYQIITDDNHSNWERVYKNGEYCYFIVRDKVTQKIIKVKELFQSKIVIKETTYSSQGIPKFEFIFDFRNGKKIRKNYLNDKGGVFCSESFDDNEKISNIQLFTHHGNENFDNLDSLTLYWLEECIDKNNDDEVVIISEYAEYKDALIKFRNNRNRRDLQTKLMIALHNNHKENGKVVPYFKAIFSRVNEYDAVICLTEEQKSDLKELLETNNIFVVPHSIVHHDFSLIKRENNRISIGGRFVPVKNIEDGIYALKEVVSELPNIKFYIFGRGKLQSEYERIIKKLNLEKNVFVAGFTDNMNEEYAKSDICLMTSVHEGFPLSLIEAMDAGAVPVCYPYKYGPKDMIENNVSGVISKTSDYHEVAELIISLLINRFKLERIRKETLKVSQIFSEDNMVNKWLEIIKSI